MRARFLVVLAACFMWLARPAAGLEISLEENRGESGSIGYVDIERVFSQHPGTLKARDEFSKELRMREELLARKKEEIYAIKAEINKLRQEREFLRCLPAVVTPPQKNGTAVLPVSTGTAISSAAMTAPVSTGTAAAAQSPVPAVSEDDSTGTAISELEDKIVDREKQLLDKENEVEQYRKKAEKEMLDMESKRSEIILGKIYVAVKELAAQEQISVVIDKRSILYGQQAVDLTDKLIAKLGGM